MFATGAVLAAIGLVLFHIALWKTITANANTPIPFGRRPALAPRGSVAMRAAGAALIVFGTVLVSMAGWYWALLVVLAGPGAAFVALSLHNRRATGTAGG